MRWLTNLQAHKGPLICCGFSSTSLSSINTFTFRLELNPNNKNLKTDKKIRNFLHLFQISS